MKTIVIERLNESMKHAGDKRLYERYLAVEGHSFAQISQLLGRVRQTISVYWKSYQEQDWRVWKWIILPDNRPNSRKA